MIRIIWYGSLMSQDSAQQTCDIFNFNYWYIQWYSRIFNKLWFNPYTETYNENTSMLNLVEDDKKMLLISYFDISEKDYKKMKKREWDYNEIEVDIFNLEQQKVSKWWVFISKQQIECNGESISLIRDDLPPEKRYLDICIDALQKTPYLDEFLDSTYMWCAKRKLEL